MNRQFNDELLSAYLDGQLSGNELKAVEAELVASVQARELLGELRAISQQVRDLPRHKARPDFADRVVQAAIAANAVELNGSQQNGQVQRAAAVSPNSAGSSNKARRGPRLSVVLAGAAAVAAAVILMVWAGGGMFSAAGPGPGTLAVEPGPGLGPDPGTPTLQSAAEAALAQLRLAFPQEGEAVVVRLRLGPGETPAEALDRALTAAGIAYRSGADDSTAAMQIGQAYRQELAARFGGVQPGVPNTALVEGTIAAADAVFIEASWESLEKAVGALAASPEQAIELCPLSKIAASLPGIGDAAVGEGEGPKGTANSAAANYAQRLPASVFRLDKAAAQLAEATLTGAAPIDGQRRVRVLLLVEPTP
jgi:hypothetical protein